MQNPNSLVTMAIVSENANDPFFAFCEYIKYCMFVNPNDAMKLPEIKSAVGKEFGIHIPTNVILACLNRLVSNGFCVQCGHIIKRQGSYDTNGYDERRKSFKETETQLITALIKYVKSYDQHWDYDYARQQLIKVLDRDGVAFDVFFNEQIKSDDTSSAVATDIVEIENDDNVDGPMFTEANLTGRFVSDVLKSDDIARDYLLKVCEGIMVCIGAYHVQNAEAIPATVQINGTAFFFDTRLLLRFVGCANDASVEATKEMVRLLQDKHGKIYYYPHTLDEINRAFSDAIDSLLHGYPPRDAEMRLYCASVNNNISIVAAKSAGMCAELSQAEIFMRPLTELTDSERIRFGFEKSDLAQYMRSNLTWDTITIENDATSIWETHNDRRGNYQSFFGTANCLGVFVTSNSVLPRIVQGFKKANPYIKPVQSWQYNRSPVITDIRLTCRIWSPTVDRQRISLLHLSANAFAAQQPTQLYMNRVRELAKALQKQVPEYAQISLTEFFDDNITASVIKATGAKEENLDIGVLASTLEEFSEMKAKEQEDVTQKVESERDEAKRQYEEQTAAIINDAVSRYLGKIGFNTVWLCLVNNWLIFVSVLFVIIAAVLAIVISSTTPLFLIAIPVVLKIIEVIVSSDSVYRKLFLSVYIKISNKYRDRIMKSLGQAEIAYKDEIVKRCLRENSMLKRFREKAKYGNESSSSDL